MKMALSPSPATLVATQRSGALIIGIQNHNLQGRRRVVKIVLVKVPGTITMTAGTFVCVGAVQQAPTPAHLATNVLTTISFRLQPIQTSRQQGVLVTSRALDYQTHQN